MSGYRLTSAYRARDRQLIFGFQTEEAPGPTFVVPLKDWLAGVGLPATEVAEALNGTHVPLRDQEPPTPFHRRALEALPTDLTGWSCLDVGGYDGLFAGECVKRGASPVRILDNGEWQNYHWRVPPTPEGVDRVGCDVLAWEQPADLLIFGNVVYHMADPWRALRHLRTLCRREMLMWTSFVPGDEPVWRVEEVPTEADAVYEGHFTVFWKPTVAGLLRLLERTGWRNISELGTFGDHVVVRCEGGPL